MADKRKLKNYLLGNLPPPEMEALDLDVIAAPEREEELLEAEHELIEDYLEEALSPADRDRFARHFLVSRERRRLMDEIAQLKDYARAHSFRPDETAAERDAGGNFFRAFINFLRGPRAIFAGVAVIVLAGWLVFAVWPRLDGRARSPLEAEFAALNRQDFSRPAEWQGFSTIQLTEGALRSGGAGNGARRPAENLTDQVFFRLALPVEVSPETRFAVELFKDGRTLFRQEDIRVYQNPAGREVRLLLPKSVFTPGQTQLRLSAAGLSNLDYQVRFD